MIDSIEKSYLISKAAFSKKADDIVIMDMRAVSTLTDYFIICSATSTRRARAICETICADLAKKGINYWHVEGEKDALWIVLDYGDVMVHIFVSHLREFYDLERLWHDAPKRRYDPSCKSANSRSC